MVILMVRKKITLTIDADIAEKAKNKAQEAGLSLSRLVENALAYYIEPQVHCFKCGFRFKINDAEVCPRCGWHKCPKCGACACDLGEESVRVAFFMRKTLIDIFSSTEV